MGLSGANLLGVAATFTLNWFGAGVENGHTGTPVRKCKRGWGFCRQHTVRLLLLFLFDIQILFP